jgi:hypothetical protein
MRRGARTKPGSLSPDTEGLHPYRTGAVRMGAFWHRFAILSAKKKGIKTPKIASYDYF